MSDDSSASPADEYEREFLGLTASLDAEIRDADFVQCLLHIESWERSHRDNPRVGAAIRNHASAMRLALAKQNADGRPAYHFGDNTTLNFGDGNISHAGANASSGYSRQVVLSGVSQDPAANKSGAGRSWRSAIDILVSILAACLAVWWCLSPEWAYGSVRRLTTVFIVVGAFVLLFLKVLTFRRQRWEKFTYILIASTFLARGGLSSCAFGIEATGAAGAEKFEGAIRTYFNVSDEPIVVIFHLAVGIVALLMARFTPVEK